MLLRQLTEACGGPGQEHEVRNILRTEIEPIAERIFTDPLGNLIAEKGKEKSGLRVMLAAHMDEVSLMVVGIEKNGMLKFKPVGGIDPRVLVAKPVVVGSQKIRGVIGSKPIHLQKPEERVNPFTLQELFIDIGAKSQEEAEKCVELGDHAYFHTKYAEFGENKVKAKALDDRVGCAMIVDLLKDEYAFPIIAAFTVQEEVGLRGAGVAAYTVEPDIAIILEGTTASDVPGSPEHKHATTVGNGPCLTFKDNSAIPNPKLVQTLLKLGAKHNIPVQLRRNTAGGTDAGKIQISKGGSRVVVIAIPCRYIHSPVSVMDIRDYQNCLKLVRAFLNSLNESEEL